MKLKSPAGTSSSSVTTSAVSPTKTHQTTATPQNTTVIHVSKVPSEHYIPQNVVLSTDTLYFYVSLSLKTGFHSEAGMKVV